MADRTLSVTAVPTQLRPVVAVAHAPCIPRTVTVAPPSYVPDPSKLPDQRILVTEGGEYVAVEQPVPDPSQLGNGKLLMTLGGEYVAADPPNGTGDMYTLVYDPNGKRSDMFNLANLTGDLDGGVF